MASTSAIPSTMQAWTYSTKGTHRSVLRINTVPTPDPPVAGNVLVKIAYSSLQTGDIKLMGLIPNFLRPKDSMPGVDFSGAIIARGPSAPAALRVGDRVFGTLNKRSLFAGIGTLCEYICLDPSKVLVMPVPENTSLEEASALACPAGMAYETCKKGSIPTGSDYKVLVNGASGGCGSMFVQGVLAWGAKEVVGTCSAANVDLVKSLGASRVIDYRANAPLPDFLSQEYGEPNEKFDFILDTVGDQHLYTNSPKYLKEDGVFLNIGDYTDGPFLTLFHWLMNYIRPTWLGGTPRKYVMFSGDMDPGSADWIVRHVAEGQLKAVVQKVYGFEEVLEALDLVETKRVRGRLVVKVGEVA